MVNRCCMYCCNEESVDHLLISCPVAHSLWMYMLRLFGIDWVMLGSVIDLFFCWYQWFGKHNSNIWNLVPGCLMWNIWAEGNRCSFEDMTKSLDQLLDLYSRTLFDWSQCWSLLGCSTFSDFLLSLRIS